MTNKKAIRLILNLFHRIELTWEKDAERRNLLAELKTLLTDYDSSHNVDLPFITRLHKHIHPEIELPHLCGLLVPVEREYDRTNVTDEDFLVTEEDNSSAEDISTMPVSVVLDNIRSAFNVGGIFRTSECLGINELYLCGYSATPDNQKVSKSAMRTQDSIKWEKTTRIETTVDQLKAEGTSIIALETVKDQPNYNEISFSFPCAILLGNERFGLSEKMLAEADHIVSIPTYGKKNSLNVVSAFSILGYEIRRQWEERRVLGS